MNRSTKTPFNGSAANRPSPSELSFAGALVESFDGSRHAPAFDRNLNADVGGMSGMHNDGGMA